LQMGQQWGRSIASYLSRPKYAPRCPEA